MIECAEPMNRFTLRWNPLITGNKPEFLNGLTTLVSFEFEDISGRTRLTIKESSFRRFSSAQQQEALDACEHWWAEQVYLLERFLAGAMDYRPIK
jgi:hypothetical protein